MSNLRAGLIGLGMMGRHHARNLRAIDGVDLVAVADAQGDPPADGRAPGLHSGWTRAAGRSPGCCAQS